MKKIYFMLVIIVSLNIINLDNAYSNLNSLSCENILTKSKANIVYGNNFAKEEMSPNIWLFFHKVSINNNFLSIISIDNEKPIREWIINLVSGEAILTPMFEEKSKWLCKI